MYEKLLHLSSYQVWYNEKGFLRKDLKVSIFNLTRRSFLGSAAVFAVAGRKTAKAEEAK